MSYGNRELSYQKTQSKQALLVFSLVCLVWGVEKWRNGKLIYLVEKKNEKIENKVCIKLLSHPYYIIQEIISLQLLTKYFLSIKIKRISYYKN